MKIYTKTGDKGSTSLFGGARVSKDDIRVEAYGSIDELNSFLGLLISKVSTQEVVTSLKAIQNELFVIGSHLASDPTKPKLKIPDLSNESILILENSIDQMDKEIPELRFFILPGGSEIISLTHVCRTVCRRAERRVVSLAKTESVKDIIIVYLNRLSDYFFVLSRYLAYQSGVDEIPWKP